jgi:hypothetical protein
VIQKSGIGKAFSRAAILRPIQWATEDHGYGHPCRRVS